MSSLKKLLLIFALTTFTIASDSNTSLKQNIKTSTKSAWKISKKNLKQTKVKTKKTFKKGWKETKKGTKKAWRDLKNIF